MQIIIADQKISDTRTLEIKEGRHPVIEGAVAPPRWTICAQMNNLFKIMNPQIIIYLGQIWRESQHCLGRQHCDCLDRPKWLFRAGPPLGSNCGITWQSFSLEWCGNPRIICPKGNSTLNGWKWTEQRKLRWCPGEDISERLISTQYLDGVGAWYPEYLKKDTLSIKKLLYELHPYVGCIVPI